MRLRDIFEGGPNSGGATRWRPLAAPPTSPHDPYIRDFVIGVNDGDELITIATDMDLDVNTDYLDFFERMREYMRKIIELYMSKEDYDIIHLLCKRWRITADELEKFMQNKRGRWTNQFSARAEARRLFQSGITDSARIIRFLARELEQRGEAVNMASIQKTVLKAKGDITKKAPR